MSEIELKENNTPKKPGTYLCKRPMQARAEMAEVREYQQGELTMLHGISHFPLKDCEKSALWSDQITIKLPQAS